MRDPRAFAADWETVWNSHDLDCIPSNYSPDLVSRSGKAASLISNGEVRGRKALRASWARALGVLPEPKFGVTDVFKDLQALVLTCRNHRGVMASEALWFYHHTLAL